MAIQNRYEFIYYVACTNANPNGDPDMGNAPRLDPQTMQGFITDVATKRRIRNYIQMAYAGQPGMNIIVQQSTNLNRHIAEAKRAAGVEDCAKAKDAVYAGRKMACEMFYDVRTFGAVMSTGPNARAGPAARADHLRQKPGPGAAIGHFHHPHGRGRYDRKRQGGGLPEKGSRDARGQAAHDGAANS